MPLPLCSLQDFFLRQLVQKLSAEQQRLCEGALTIKQCKGALDGMAMGKTPGLDVLPAEFYQCFWPLTWEDFVEVMKGRLPFFISVFQADHSSVKVW